MTSAKNFFEGLPPIVQIAAGETHYLALANTGHIYAWGSNFDGECGLGWAPEEIDEPTPIKIVLNSVRLISYLSDPPNVGHR